MRPKPPFAALTIVSLGDLLDCAHFLLGSGEVGHWECWDCFASDIHPATEVVNEYVIVTACIMNQRFVAAVIVGLAVLFSQGGGSVMAAICPHLRSQHNASCHETQPEDSAAHHDMNRQNDAPVFETDERTVSCNHCAVHSRTRPDDSALQSTESVQRASDPSVAISFSVAPPASQIRAVAWTANAHGPPGDSEPLHLLLNIFRI